MSIELVHELTTIERRYAEPALGLWIAWCLCGVGSPPKTTPESAAESTRRHIDTGELPK